MSDEHHNPTPDDLRHELQEHDEWFKHTPDEPQHQAAHGETSGLKIAAFLVIVIIFVFATAGVLITMFKASAKEQLLEAERRADNLAEPRFEMQEQWDTQLSSYGWVDQEAGVVHVPFDEAVQRTLEDYSN